jgi:hypothetical protein
MLVSAKKRIAQKPYECALSRKPINKGDEYYSVFQKFPEGPLFLKVSKDAWDFVMSMWDAMSNTMEEDGIDAEMYDYLYHTVRGKELITFANGDTIVV